MKIGKKNVVDININVEAGPAAPLAVIYERSSLQSLNQCTYTIMYHSIIIN